MRHLGSFRMYEPVVREMAARGHHVHLALGRAEALGWKTALETLLVDCPTITWGWMSPPASAFWSEVAKTIRLWADYLRYFQPEYDSTPKLKSRAEERVPPRLVSLSKRPVFRKPQNRQRLLTLLRVVERALPPAPEIEGQLRDVRPDVVLITPLVYLGSSQFEILRASLALGLRTAFYVGSWDHLSSKALIRDMPHRVLVWNETQKQEAVLLHGVPADRVVVTGHSATTNGLDGGRSARVRSSVVGSDCRPTGRSSSMCARRFFGAVPSRRNLCAAGSRASERPPIRR